MSSTTYVVQRPFWMGGQVQEAGAQVDLSDAQLASMLLWAGSIAPAPPPAAAGAQPEAAAAPATAGRHARAPGTQGT